MLSDLANGIGALTKNFETLSASVEEIKKAGPKAIDANAASSLVEPHAKQVEDAADGMEKAGLGGHATRGHVAVLRHMAGCMRADAAKGQMPHVYKSTGQFYAAADKGEDAGKALAAKLDDMVKSLADGLKALGTQLADLKAAARQDSPAPERKSLKPELTALLAKAGIETPADGSNAKIDLPKLDGALKDFGFQKQLEIKAALSQAGML